MLQSAEIRWFWRGALPPGLEDWFRGRGAHPCAAGGGGTRTDEYLRDPGQGELGIKSRGGKPGLEIKGLVEVATPGLAVAPFAGPVEIWVKWSCEALDLGSRPRIPTEKQRWLRKFDTAGPTPEEIPLDDAERPVGGRPLPERGCNVELTRVGLPAGIVWWTLGFEAFGRLATLQADLAAAAAALAGRRPPPLPGGILASYPAWLDRHAGA
jgi:hypothetical protein